MKKITLLVLILAICGIFVACTGDSAEQNDDTLKFILDSEGNYTVKIGDDLTVSEIIIPSAYKGKPVAGIADGGFAECKNLKKILIPDSINTIGYNAFLGCEALTEINLPDSITTIGASAFAGCKLLKEISIPNGVTAINSLMFSDPYFSFEDMYGIITDSFDVYDTYVEKIIIGSGVTNIEDFSFLGMKNLKTIVVDENNPNYKSVDGILFNKDGTVLIKFPEKNDINHYEIPEGVTEISEYAFATCTNIDSIIVPSSVNNINENAFSRCSSLASIVLPDSLKDIKYNTFYKCSSLVNINFPSELENIEEHAFYECSSLVNVNLPKGLKKIGGYAFYKGSSFESIEFDYGLLYIGDYAFSDCTSLSSINIPDSVVYLGAGAFDGCSSLTEAVVGNSVPMLIRTFSNCTSLENVSIGSGVTSLQYCFSNCTSLESVIIPDSVINIYSEFYKCNSLKEIVFGKNVTSIDRSFGECNMLEKIVIPDSVINIDGCFNRCEALKEVTLGTGINKINNTFRNCTNLEKVVFNAEYIEFDNMSFSSSNALREFVINESALENISIPMLSRFVYISTNLTEEENCKYFCINGNPYYLLVKAELPKEYVDNYYINERTVIIGSSAFGPLSCSCIYIPDSVVIIGENAFNNRVDANTVILGNGIKRIEKRAFSSFRSIEYIEYKGDEQMWLEIDIQDGNDNLLNAPRYYFD